MSTFGGVSVIFAVASVFTGVQAIINPAGFATSFGIPLPPPSPKHEKAALEPRATPATEEAAASSVHMYVALLGVRQVGTGITLLVFAYQGKWVESATVLAIIGIVVAGMDGYHIVQSGSLGGGLFHAIPGALIAALAAATVVTSA
ncbi:hypothetical protein diail_8985 [Diaporthe ilicicola]|nr:hypothetical protein diail_8985 [Diaporthe ilicicola]